MGYLFELITLASNKFSRLVSPDLGEKGFLLNKRTSCFIRQDVQCLLKTLDLCGALLSTLLIWFRLSNALLLDLSIVFQNGIQFLLNRRLVAGKLSTLLVESVRLLQLVLNIL